MGPKILLPLIFIILLFHIMASGLIMPVSAHSLSISNPVSVLMSQLATSQDEALELWLIIVMFPYLVATVFFTGASDKHGRKIMLIRCLGLSSLGYFLIAINVNVNMNNIFFSIMAMMFLAVGSSGTAVIQAFIVDNCDTQFKKCCCFAGVTAIMTVAYIPMAQLSNYLLHVYYSVTFGKVAIAALVFSLGSLILSILFLPNTKQHNEKKLNFEDLATSIAHILSIPKVRALLVSLILFQFSWGIFFQNIYYHMTHFHQFSHKITCLFITFLCITSGMILLFVYPIIIRYCTLNKLIYVCLSFCSLGFLLCGYSSLLPLWVVAIIIAAGSGMAAPTLWTLLSDQIDGNHQGILMGLTGMIWVITWTLSGALENALNAFSLLLPVQISTLIAILALLHAWFLNQKFFKTKNVVPSVQPRS